MKAAGPSERNCVVVEVVGVDRERFYLISRHCRYLELIDEYLEKVRSIVSVERIQGVDMYGFECEASMLGRQDIRQIRLV